MGEAVLGVTAGRAPGAPVPVVVGNTYDKYASKNPVERRLMGVLRRPRPLLPAPPRPGCSRSASARARSPAGWPGGGRRRRSRRRPARPGAGGHWTGGLRPAVRRQALPFPDATFDLVLAIEVLEHVGDPGAALRELARVAGPDRGLGPPGAHVAAPTWPG